MKLINGNFLYVSDIDSDELKSSIGKSVRLHGYIYKIRKMSGFAFVILRMRRALIQCVYSPEFSEFEQEALYEGSCVTVTGMVIPDERSRCGFEVRLISLTELSKPASEYPVVINNKKLDISIDNLLNLRPLTLRNEKERAIFKIQEGLARGFRNFLYDNKFTEIHTPKIVFAGAEGGANIFGLDYFDKKAYLTQSPQFYKQMMVGVYERVFEIAPVYRAEKHDTSRHLNEYTSMDIEMGFIKGFEDIMRMEVSLLQYMLELLVSEYEYEMSLHGVDANEVLEELREVPVISFMEVKGIIEHERGCKCTDYFDFEPDEEQLLCGYTKKKYGSRFVFVTHYPSVKRPFYAMDDPSDDRYTLSFDLLFSGLEITTGGQRIHYYNEQISKMNNRGMNVPEFESYLMLHKYGTPPHGGFGMGLERLTMKLLNLHNVRQACLFPRDKGRVTP